MLNRFDIGRRDVDQVYGAISELEALRAHDRRILYPSVRDGVSGVVTAKHGDLIVADVKTNDATIYLPPPSPQTIGAAVTVASLGTNTAYVYAPSGSTIHDTWIVYPITNSVPPVTFVQVSEKRYEQIGGPMERVWVEWNGLDLSQFDSPIDGDLVNSSSDLSVQTTGGVNWIWLGATSTGSSGAWPRTTRMLPFSKMPPTNNYRIDTSFVPETVLVYSTDTYYQAGVFCRLVRGSPDKAYFAMCRFFDLSASVTRQGVWSGNNVASLTQLGGFIEGPPLNATPDKDEGIRFGLSCRHDAASPTRVTLMSHAGIEQQLCDDTGSPLLSGKCGLMTMANTTLGATCSNYYKDIKVTLLD